MTTKQIKFLTILAVLLIGLFVGSYLLDKEKEAICLTYYHSSQFKVVNDILYCRHPNRSNWWIKSKH